MNFKRLLEFDKEGIARSALIVLSYNLVERIIMMGRGIVFARVLGPAEYGVFTLGMSFFPVAVAIAKLGIPSSFSRYIAQYELKGVLRDFLRRTYGLIALGAAGIGLVSLLVAPQIARWGYGSSQYTGVVLLCALIVAPYVFYESLDATFVGLRTFKLQSLLKFGHFVIFTLLGIVLVLVYRRAQPLIASYLAATVVVVLFYGGVLARHVRQDQAQQGPLNEPGFYRKIFSFSVPYIVSPVVFIMFCFTDRWMLARLMDLQHVGIYSAATRFSELVYSFGRIADNVLSPNLSRMWEEGERDRAMRFLNMSTKVNTLLLLAGSLVLFWLKDLIIPLFFGDKYLGSLPVIGILLMFAIFQTIGTTISGFVILIEKTYILPVSHVLGLGANLALNLFLIPKYGILGAAMACTISSAFIVVVLMAWLAREGLKISWSTLAVSVLPLLLLLSGPPAILLALALLLVILRTDWVLDGSERKLLFSQLDRVKAKFLPPRPNPTGSEPE